MIGTTFSAKFNGMPRKRLPSKSVSATSRAEVGKMKAHKLITGLQNVAILVLLMGVTLSTIG